MTILNCDQIFHEIVSHREYIITDLRAKTKLLITLHIQIHKLRRATEFKSPRRKIMTYILSCICSLSSYEVMQYSNQFVLTRPSMIDDKKICENSRDKMWIVSIPRRRSISLFRLVRCLRPFLLVALIPE